jgi:hypothetical protein
MQCNSEESAASEKLTPIDQTALCHIPEDTVFRRVGKTTLGGPRRRWKEMMLWTRYVWLNEGTNDGLLQTADDTMGSLKYCGVFTPYKNWNIETRSRDCAIVDEAVFSPCRAEDSRPEPRRAEPGTNRYSRRIASPHLLLPGNRCKHLNDTEGERSRDRASSDVMH